MTLHFYFARRFTLVFMLITLVLFSLIILVDIIDQSRRFSDAGLTFGDLFRLTLLNAPQTINLILPLIMILATVTLFISMARTSELVATRAAGRSALRILIAPLTVALIIGVLAVSMLNPIVAATSKRYLTVSESYRAGGASALSISDEGLWLRQGGPQGQSVIRALRSNNNASVLFDVTFLTYAKGGSPVERIEAASAELQEGRWQLRNAKVWSLKDGVNSEAESEFHVTYTLPSTLTIERIRESFGAPTAVSIYDLPEFIRALEQAGFSPRRHMVWLQAELARPLFLIAMVLVASAFTMRHTRLGGTGVAVLMSILLGFGLYFIRSFAHILGENGQIPIFLAAWAAPVASVLLALGLLLHAEDG